jgi:hypothetical protein
MTESDCEFELEELKESPLILRGVPNPIPGVVLRRGWLGRRLGLAWTCGGDGGGVSGGVGGPVRTRPLCTCSCSSGSDSSSSESTEESDERPEAGVVWYRFSMGILDRPGRCCGKLEVVGEPAGVYEYLEGEDGARGAVWDL